MAARTSPYAHLRRAALVLAVVALASLPGCSRDLEDVPEIFRPTNAHDAYRHGLVEAGLGATALSRDWIGASEAALRDPVPVEVPFRESGYFDEATAAAIGYRFSVRGGQLIEAELQVVTPGPTRIFMDLFRLVDDAPQVPVHVATGATLIEPPGTVAATPDPAPELVRRLQLEPLRDGTYVLRVQPELLRSARYTVQISVDGSLTFPVSGHEMRHIWSAFGADREGGRRSHRGVDIFAPRGTPVVAATDGVVTRVDTTDVGGHVVWMNAANRNVRFYYAHLESQTVRRGQAVVAGDQLGTVGNSGNAITTPPHLHFGVYARGAVDPDPFLRPLPTIPADVTADTSLLGAWARTAADGVDVLDSPVRRGRVIGSLDRNTPLRVWAASAGWYRVALPTGASGYVVANATEPATPLRSESLTTTAPVLDRPSGPAAVIEELGAGAEVPVLGTFGDFLYVQTPAGLNGWLSFH